MIIVVDVLTKVSVAEKIIVKMMMTIKVWSLLILSYNDPAVNDPITLEMVNMVVINPI